MALEDYEDVTEVLVQLLYTVVIRFLLQFLWNACSVTSM